MGNMIELCVADLYPDPKIYLGFTMCLFNDYKQVPQQELVNNCALEHGVETDRLDQCIQRDDGQYSMDLLRQSIRRSKAANVTYSCTVSANPVFPRRTPASAADSGLDSSRG